MAVRAPAIPTSLEWINTGNQPIALAELRGQVVLLDFWTAGCINCLHIIPSLHRLEERFGGVLAVIGVHSGKFPAERETAAIRDAVMRLDVHHPVVNDRQFRIWREYAIRGWPSIVLLDARGYVVHQAAGEFEVDALGARIAALVTAASDEGILIRRPSRAVPEAPAVAPGALRYPGKLAIDGDRVAIADTGHHRVLVGTVDARRRRMHIQTILGAGDPGFADGSHTTAQLRSPQGVAFAADRLVIADAGNHAVRIANLATGSLTTLAGTGRRVRTSADRAAGALASPWDVAVAAGVAWIAMAGSHQLWGVPLDGRTPYIATGSGAEELHDALPHEAALAQPMGLVAHDGALWFVDAESSAVRRAPLENTEPVRTLVGTGLFDFGDRDGIGDDVRLQHPQGIAVARDGTVLIADSYNGAIKRLDPATRTVTTLRSGLKLPSGIANSGDDVFIAETGAHRIATLDGEVEITFAY